MNIVLIGFMGAGKSAVSECFHKCRGMEIVDMDEEIARREGMSIPDIFAKYGEAYFRDLETNLLIELQSKDGMVISCGGGAALRPQNVIEMKKNGTVVFLKARPETVYERVKDSDDRPILKGNNNVAFIAELMEQRREKYEMAADFAVQTDNRSVEEICTEITERIEEMGYNYV